MLLDLARLRRALQYAPIGHTLDYHYSTPSTMPLAHKLARQPGTRSGLVVVAEEQTAGRGRLARRWEAPPGQALLISLILQPPLAFAPAEISIRTALAVALALEQVDPMLRDRVGLKWPNDLLVGDTPADARKVAGILVESEWQGNELRHCVLGIGVNVNQGPDQMPARPSDAPAAVSLRTFLRRAEPLDRTSLLVTLCLSLGEQLAFAGEPPTIQRAWSRRLWTLGQWVNVVEAGVLVWHGQATAVGTDGGLVVVNEVGEARHFLAGEVTVRNSAAMTDT